MNPNFRLDEKILKNIIHTYISPTGSNNEIKFTIYYKKNLKHRYKDNEKKNNVIYQFKYPLGECISIKNL